MSAETKGLEGVVVTDSSICVIDGQEGSLRYRGIDIGDLARHSNYEETVYLLWFGELPNRVQLDAFRARLAAEREIDDALWDALTALPRRLPAMDALSAAVSVLSCCDPGLGDHSPRANVDKAIRLTAKMPTIIANYQRYVEGKGRVSPDPGLDHAANFLFMLRGQMPMAVEGRAMDMMLVLMAEHELNASTFAARITASTLSDMYASIISALGALKGPLHGGANQEAMEMLLEIGSVENVEPYIAAALSAKKRIMGFGHRVYKTIDPRAVHLREMLHEMGLQAGDLRWSRLSQAVAETVEKNKGLYPNVDFFTAPLFFMLGIPVGLFTSIFAMSRVAGWTAHVMEQYAHNRLMRPLSSYVGPLARPYVSIEGRNGHFRNEILESQ